MRGTVAKRLRRQVYGSDFSSRERHYKDINGPTQGRKQDGLTPAGNPNWVDILVPGTLVNTGRRQSYLKLKKEHIHGRG
jgi:hypothetical protein